MSTQEREAMERLEAWMSQVGSSCGYQSDAFRALESELMSLMPLKDPASAKSLPVVTAVLGTIQKRAESDYLSRHARSRQPITVEGLVAMGFEEFHPNCFSNDIVMFWPNYVHENERWRIMKTGRSIPKEAAPQTMLDVDQLIERLSR
jgi:hypothetical protein